MKQSLEDFIHAILHEAVNFGKTEESESRELTEDFIFDKLDELRGYILRK